MRTLDELRGDIDRVDEVLVRLLNERARGACEIGWLKKELASRSTSRNGKRRCWRTRGVAVEGPLGSDADRATVRT